jgi:hypothetical protein
MVLTSQASFSQKKSATAAATTITTNVHHSDFSRVSGQLEGEQNEKEI